MNMLGIDFSQMFAPQAAPKGGAGKMVPGGEGFLAALNQLASQGQPKGAQSEDLLAALLNRLGLQRPEMKQKLLQWLEGSEGQQMLEKLFADQRVNLDELVELLDASGLAAAGDLTILTTEQAHAGTLPESSGTNNAERSIAASGTALEKGDVQGKAEVQTKVEAEGVTKNGENALPDSTREGKTSSQAAAFVKPENQAPKHPTMGAALHPGAQVNVPENPTVQMKSAIHSELEARLKEGLRNGQVKVEPTPGTARSTEEVLAEAETTPFRQISAAKTASTSLESRLSDMIGLQAKPEAVRNQGENSRVQVAAAEVSLNPEVAVKAGNMGNMGGQMDLDGFFHRESAQQPQATTGTDQGAVFSLDSARASQPSPVAAPHQPGSFQMPSGALMQESHLLDQVVQKMNLHSNGDRSQMTVRLHPEELGALKLELVMEKGGIKAHIQAQTPQVQEVLERHMHRLREAFANQGLQLDDVEVSLDSSEQGNRDAWLSHNSQGESGGRSFRSGGISGAASPSEPEGAPIPVAANDSGISLRI